MLHARLHGVCTVHEVIQGDLPICTGVRITHAVRGGTKPMSKSTRCQGWCPAVEKLASLQQAPGRLHAETWAGRGDNPSLFSPGSGNHAGVCGHSCSPSSLLPFSSVSPGPGREVRNWLGWTFLEKTARSGVWGLRGVLVGSSVFFALVVACDWVRKRPFLTAWASSHFVFLFICVWARHGCRTTIWEAVLDTAG